MMYFLLQVINLLLNNNNISALARKVERLETEIKNLSKDIDRIQDNDNPLSM